MTSQQPAGGLGGGHRKKPHLIDEEEELGQGLQAMQNLSDEAEELTGQGLQAKQDLSAAAQV